MPIQAAPTVRESLEAAVDAVPVDQPVPAPEAIPQAEVKAETPAASAQETEAEKAERLRNKDGTFAKGKPEVKAAEVKPAEAPKPKVPRPSSWKKELETHWDTLAPEVQAYVGQREREYATGVSTYKTEADRAKEVMSAISEFQPTLEQYRIPVAQWIQQLGRAHHVLTLGSPQDKVNTVAQIMRNNGVDPQALFQVLSGQQPQYQQQQAQPQQQLRPQDIEAAVQRSVDERFVNEKVSAEYKAFTEAKDEAGNAKYPHFEEVKATMAGLLQAELAQSLAEAYEAALHHPKHANLFQAAQQQQAEAKEAERVKAAQQQATRARSQAVSVKSSTPSAMAQPATAKGLREQLSDALDSVTTRRV